MSGPLPSRTLTRRTLLAGAAGMGAAVLAGCAGSGSGGGSSGATAAGTTAAAPSAPQGPLWRTALDRGLVFGSSTATWQVSDDEYARLFDTHAALMFTEDDLLWYRLKPTPKADLDFSYSDRMIEFAERRGMLVFAAHLAWDEGFGEGWTDEDLYGMGRREARDMLLGTADRVVRRYRGRVAAWSVVNEALDGSGVRTNVPWYVTVGPDYIPDSFHVAREADPGAVLVYNETGFETDDEFSTASGKRQATLDLLDDLLAKDVPVDALGVQGHLNTSGFAEAFDEASYRRFLSDVADRDLRILITELDVQDDGLPASPAERDRGVADTYRRYLEVALDEPAVAAVMAFGLSDRYTWLQEDYPRADEAPRRPLAFDEELRPKPAFDAIAAGLAAAAEREPWLVPPRAGAA